MDYNSHPMKTVHEIKGPATVSFVSVNGDARHYFAGSRPPTSDPVQEARYIETDAFGSESWDVQGRRWVIQSSVVSAIRAQGQQEERNMVAAGYEGVTRVEVIDETGRVYVRYGVTVTSDLQDKGRTLKLFVTPAAALREVKP